MLELSMKANYLTIWKNDKAILCQMLRDPKGESLKRTLHKHVVYAW